MGLLCKTASWGLEVSRLRWKCAEDAVVCTCALVLSCDMLFFSAHRISIMPTLNARDVRVLSETEPRKEPMTKSELAIAAAAAAGAAAAAAAADSDDDMQVFMCVCGGE